MFDKQGNVILDDEPGKKVLTCTYDEHGNVLSKSYSSKFGEEVCTLSYKGAQVITTCHTIKRDKQQSLVETIDSCRSDSLALARFHKTWHIENDDTILSNSRWTRFAYDGKGNTISVTTFLQNGEILSWKKSAYDESDRLVITREGVGTNDWCQDSVAYQYDAFNRLSRIKRFQYRRSAGYAVTTSVIIHYDDRFDPIVANDLNETVIRANKPAMVMDLGFYPTDYPTEVQITINDIDDPGGKANTDMTWYYNYDATGRLMNITGTGYIPYAGSVDLDVGIDYYDSTAVVNHYATNSAGERTSRYTENYVNGLLISASNNSEWGFPLQTTKYIYTYYE